MARQGELFGEPMGAGLAPAAPPLLRHQLTRWQSRLAEHQAPLFAGLGSTARQGSLLQADDPPPWPFNPLQLQPQPLSFWRGAAPLVRGPALYFVMDQPEALDHPLLLYVGETAHAEQRWKGEHDCKSYLAAYGDALQRAELGTWLSIRFWCDVPAQTRARRQLEQALIRQWLPPFNKETRGRWATPFQA